MKHRLNNYSKTKYDLIVIGGGIYGACIAWDATLRGLNVALFEKGDFGSATSSNSQKIIHGGFRYLQNVDFKRMRESINERKILMRIAPHLVHQIPCLIPTYGHLFQGKELFKIALALYNFISFDRNHNIDSSKYIPKCEVVSKEECLKLLPGINKNGLTGAAQWHDAQAYNTERLILSFILSAVERGADVLNYAEVTGLIKESEKIAGVKVKDKLSGASFELKAKMVVNSCGPWLNQVLGLLNQKNLKSNYTYAKGINIVTRQLVKDYAFGVSGKIYSTNGKAKLRNSSQFFFITPWREYTIIGTTYESFAGMPDELMITGNEIDNLVFQINNIYPPARLKRKDILFYQTGLVPISKNKTGNDKINFLKHFQITDHSKTDGLHGLISVLGVKYTTARYVAEKTVNLVFKKLKLKSPPSRTRNEPIYGGEITCFEDFLNKEKSNSSTRLKPEIIKRLIYNYGSVYRQILKYSDKNYKGCEFVSSDSPVLKSEVVHAVRKEMAQKLSDVVLRRTELGTTGNPGDEAIKNCAEIMGCELNWDKNKIKREIKDIKAIYNFYEK